MYMPVMATEKEFEATQVFVNEADSDSALNHDAKDMHRLGKAQEFKRNFGFLALLGFSSIYSVVWEYVLVSLATGFFNGGFSGLFWMFIGTVLAYATMIASLAELTSMCPTAGGQYHWTSEFAPKSSQALLSYLSGWMSGLAWIASYTSGAFVGMTLTEVAIQVINPDFAFTNWQQVLVMWAFVLVTIALNIWGASILPALEVASLVGHLGGFVVFVAVFLALCPKNSASDVFLNTFESNSGWDLAPSLLISQVTILYCNIGYDAICHMTEESSNASWEVPRAMWLSFVLNSVLGLAMLVVMLFCIGPLDQVLQDTIPYLSLFLNTGSIPWAMVLIIYLWVILLSGNITALAATSREVWAFSRDKGFPFSAWIRVVGGNAVPHNAVYLTSIAAALLCLINLGSTLGFNIVVSLSVLGLVSTYTLSIGCLLLKRLRGEPLPPARWSLGRWGLPINAFAVAYSLFLFVLASFPSQIPVYSSTANYAPAVWFGVLVLSLVVWVVHGRKHYTPPVVFIEGVRKSDEEIQHT